MIELSVVRLQYYGCQLPKYKRQPSYNVDMFVSFNILFSFYYDFDGNKKNSILIKQLYEYYKRFSDSLIIVN